MIMFDGTCVRQSFPKSAFIGKCFQPVKEEHTANVEHEQACIVLVVCQIQSVR